MKKFTRTGRGGGLLLTLAVLLLAGCGGSDGDTTGPDFDDPSGPDTPAPQPGTLTARLTTPNSDDAAIQFRVTATGSQTISGVSAACSGCTLFSKTVSGTEVRGVVVGAIPSGAILTLNVSDINSASAYTVTVVAATNDAFVLRPATGYSVTVGS